MASVHGMAFSGSEFSLIENKGVGGGFLWQDPHDEAGPADFFDEFVVLDGADSSTISTMALGGDLGRLRGAGVPLTPPATSGVPMAQQQQRQMRGGPVVVDAHHLDMVDMGGLPPNYREGPGMGSISDSELLKLEGLTMRSPRAQMDPMSSSVPPSPTRGASPRKTGRLEALYVKARDKMATMQGRKVRLQQPQLSTAKMEPVKRRAPSKSHFPDSPPPRDSMPHNGQPSTSAIELNSATLADLFPGADLTPLHTPLVNGFPPATNGGQAASWSFADPNSFSTSSSDSFWVSPNDAMDMDIDDPSFFTTSFSSNTGAYHLPMRHQTSGPSGPSGLMIHMPQPRGPSSAVLHPSQHAAMSQPQAHAQPHFHYPPPPPIPNTNTISPRRHRPRAPSSGARHHHYPPGNNPSPRKPAPSSSGSIPPSPSPGASAPHPRLHRRSASMPLLRPTSLTDHPTFSASALRKRKSWTGRRVSNSHPHPTGSSPRKGLSAQQRRASSSNLRSTSNSHPNSHSYPASSTSSAEPTPTQPAGGFVNYTPEDHKVLMRGVAPSGSSKTKARRDREAQEQKRKLGEAVRMAVAAAGGDVTKLEGEGIVLGMGLLDSGSGGGNGGGEGRSEGRSGGMGMGMAGRNAGEGEGRRKGRGVRRVSFG